MSGNGTNLSDTRGNNGGIAFFRLLLSVAGVRVSGLFVWFVAFFYALFDREARQRALPYLRSRFPNASSVALWWHFYRMAVSVGQVLILGHVCREACTKIPITQYGKENLKQLISTPGQGLILLMSHAGCWQAGMAFMEKYGRPVNLLIQTNSNQELARMFTGSQFKVIGNESAFGGLLESLAALERGEILCIMGDRVVASSERTVEMHFLGRALRIPFSPWLIAARSHAPIVPIFTMMNGQLHGIDFYFSKPINLKYDLPQKPKPEAFTEYINAYSQALSNIADKYPYQIFQFEEKKEKNNG